MESGGTTVWQSREQRQKQSRERVEQRARRPQQREELNRREQMRDESSAETRVALRGEKNRGAKAQRCRGATGRVSCDERERETLAGTLARSAPI